MNIVILGAMAGGISGAVGYFLAGKVHGSEKGNELYPLYAVALFCTAVLINKFAAL